MSRYKDFDAARAEATGTPVVFKKYRREYTLPPSLPLIVKLDLMALDNKGVEDLSGPASIEMIERVLGKDNFDDLLARGITEEELGTIFVWAIRTYAGMEDNSTDPNEIRPEALKSTSSTSGRKSKRTSKGNTG